MKILINSIFTKLFIVLIATGLCINILVISFFWHIHKSRIRTTVQQHVLQYINYLIKDIGEPPDYHRAQVISEQSSIEIMYKSSDRSWATSNIFPPLNKMSLHLLQKNPSIWIAWYHGKHFIVVDQKQGKVMFTKAKRDEHDFEELLLVLFLIVLLTFIIAGAYIVLRWLLRPLKWLTKGVEEVSKGNLEHQIVHKRSDELGQLTDAFNDMTARINDMLHAKEQLLLGVSHELRSPLTRIKLAIEFLPESKTRNLLSADVREMEKMVSEILEAARIRSGHHRLTLKPVNIVDLIKETTEVLKNQPPGIVTENLPSEVMVPGDSEKIKTVLKNILNNALTYSASSDKPVTVSLEQNMSTVVIHIKDRGIGIPNKELPFIFEPFYRVDKSRCKDTGGYGLGLNLCKTIMEAHNGKIGIDSEPGKGTVVSLFFPLWTVLNSPHSQNAI